MRIRILLTRLMLAGFIAAALLPGHAHAASTQYSYDALGRVLTAVNDDGSYLEYAYDNAGNRTVVKAGAPVPPPPPPPPLPPPADQFLDWLTLLVPDN